MMSSLCRILIFLIIYVFSSWLWAEGSSNGTDTNHIAVGQGVSSPNIGTSVTASNGYTSENPVVASYQSGYRASAIIDGARSTSAGLEVGLGDGTFGMNLGYYTNSCSGCEGYVRGQLSSIWGNYGVGVSLEDGFYNLGFMLNPYGINRWGLIIEQSDVGYSTDGMRFGFGYAYVIPKFTFSLDVSKRSIDDPLLSDGPLTTSAGIAIRIDEVSVSATADFFIGGGYTGANQHIWFGINYRYDDVWDFALYGEFQDQWTLSSTYYFD